MSTLRTRWGFILRLPDPLHSKAVLIGCGDYRSPDLLSIPAVSNNLRDLGAVLADPEFGGFNGCTIFNDPSSAAEIHRSLLNATQDVTDVLLIYYAGHGIIGRDGELFLGLTDTEPDLLDATSLAFSFLRRLLMESLARIKVVVLDCCFSGRALEALSSASASFAGLTGMQGTYVLTSSSANALALARSGEPYTAFTGELIRLLSQGAAGGPEILSVDFIFTALTGTLTALGYPRPTRSYTDNVATLGLVRNRSFGLSKLQPSRLASPPVEPPAGESPVGESPEKSEDDLDWSADAPATTDMLQRAPLAVVIAERLRETQRTDPGTSFLMHLDGPWGSGKSSLLNLVEERVADTFRVVRFDAWQQSRLAPSWWSLLTSLRREITRSRPRWRRPFIRVRESIARVRRTGAPYALALTLVAVIAAALAYVIWPKNPTLVNWQEQTKAATALLAALGTLTAGALLAARLLLWDSARGAKLFEQTQANPMSDISDHFRWLIRRSDKPIAFFIDDLDRCDQKHVVDLLDTIQTLVRGMGVPQSKTTERAAYFIVAADGVWLRRSYETAHSSFVDCVATLGQTLGHLFLDKLFQLTLPMPTLTGAAQSGYLDAILGISEAQHQRTGPGSSRQPDSPVTDGGFERRMQQFSEGRAKAAVTAQSGDAERRRTGHTLQKFAPVLGDNPRTAKRFLNIYSILRSIRNLEGVFIDPDTLALWSLISVRWPNIAQHLGSHPDAVRGISDPLWCTDHFPEPLRATAASSELRAVVTSAEGGPLTPELIRKCSGIRSPSPAA